MKGWCLCRVSRVSQAARARSKSPPSGPRRARPVQARRPKNRPNPPPRKPPNTKAAESTSWRSAFFGANEAETRSSNLRSPRVSVFTFEKSEGAGPRLLSNRNQLPNRPSSDGRGDRFFDLVRRARSVDGAHGDRAAPWAVQPDDFSEHQPQRPAERAAEGVRQANHPDQLHPGGLESKMLLWS